MNSSKHVRFTPSELEALNTWTGLQEFGLQRSESLDVSEVPPTLTVEAIEAMQKQAYDEAFSQGQEAGFQQGQQEGFVEGHKQGYDVGYQKGYADHQHILQEQANAFLALMAALTEPFQNLDREVEAELVKLCIAIAKQVTLNEISINPSQIETVIRAAISALPLAEQKVTLTLHPEDADLVRTILKPEDDLPAWRLRENALLTRGGCTVETETSYIDATLEHRLADVVAKLLKNEPQVDSES